MRVASNSDNTFCKSDLISSSRSLDLLGCPAVFLRVRRSSGSGSSSLFLAFLYFEFCIPHSSLQLKNWIARTHVLGFHSYSLGNKMRMYPSVQNARKPSLANEDMQFNLGFLEATSIVRLYTSFTRNRWPSKKRKSYSTTFNIELSRRRIFLVSLFQSRPSVRQTIFLQQ